MENVLTLITPNDSHDLEDGAQAEARTVLAELGARLGETTILKPDIALDIPFEGLPPVAARAAVRQRIEGWPIDVIAQPAENRRKKLLIADMDSTIVIGETLDDLADHAGLKDKVARITERAMNGEVGFRGALVERVGLLKGLSESMLAETMADTALTSGARTLVQTMRQNGAYCALVSGGFTYFTEQVADICGFHTHRGNILNIENGQLTGTVGEPIVNKDTKLDCLKTFSAERNIDLKETCAVGDGANDLPMLMAAGLGIAFHAKPVVAAEAKYRIEFNDLTALLYAQGYRVEEFAK